MRHWTSEVDAKVYHQDENQAPRKTVGEKTWWLGGLKQQRQWQFICEKASNKMTNSGSEAGELVCL